MDADRIRAAGSALRLHCDFKSPTFSPAEPDSNGLGGPNLIAGFAAALREAEDRPRAQRPTATFRPQPARQQRAAENDVVGMRCHGYVTGWSLFRRLGPTMLMPGAQNARRR